jgi:translation initiation factor eIF-2B subunit epsilon
MIGLNRERPAWHRRLTSLFNNDTRLVGAAVSCEGTPLNGDPKADWLTLPHMRSDAVAVDQVRGNFLVPIGLYGRGLRA